MGTAPRQKKTRPELTREQWDAFLYFLVPNPEQAAREYIRIKDILIRWFALHNCSDPESQCDETMDRAARRVSEPDFKLESVPIAYLRGVARYVLIEDGRKPAFDDLTEDMPQPSMHENEFSDEDLQCLKQCLGQLKSAERELIEHIYLTEGKKKDLRKLLVIEIGSANALRHRELRIRRKLASCITKCKKVAGVL